MDKRESSSDDTPRKAKRSKHLNCAECRRLKLKCDRTVPCQNCVKRSCQHLCPYGARVGQKRTLGDADTEETKQHLEYLESLLEKHGIEVPSGRERLESGMPRRSASESSKPASRAGDAGETAQPSNGVGVAATASSGSGQGSSRITIPPPAVPASTVITQPQGSSATSQSHPVYIIPTIPLSTTQGISHSAPIPLDNNQSFSSDTSLTAFDANGGASVLGRRQRSESDTSPSGPEQSHGTLVISHSGRSKYLGPTAASEWLKDQEVVEVSRPPSPRTAGASRSTSPVRTIVHHVTSFPFPAANAPSSSSLKDGLPSVEDAESLIESYFRYFGWSYNVIARPDLRGILDKVYPNTRTAWGEPMPTEKPDPQQLALLYIVFAMGALHNLELPTDDYIAEEYCAYARDCLVKGNFMTHNTMSGVQTLTIMAHFHLETDKGRDGDSAWPLWGLAMRIAQARMGLHRDGARWNLPPLVVEERRRVFWELHSAEVFQANCFSRPVSLTSDYIDTSFPTDISDYHKFKFRLSKISDAVLHTALSVHEPGLARSDELYNEVCALEREIPFELRCRPALLALPSVYTDTQTAEKSSPVVNRRNVREAFAQHMLSLMISETIINLYRPYFIRALAERPEDPTHSAYGHQFLSIVERNNCLIQIVCGLYELFPAVTARHWWCWYHAFNAAVSFGTLLLISPHTVLAPVALGKMDQVISAYSSVVQLRTSPRLTQNLRWLMRLRRRAAERMAQPPDQTTYNEGQSIELDASLIGWRTRLVERAAKGVQRATTISSSSPQSQTLMPTSYHVTGISPPVLSGQPTVSDIVPADTTPDQASGALFNDSTTQLLHDFWDPAMMLQEFGDTNETGTWWENMFPQLQ